MPMTTIKGTKKLMTLEKTKFCTHWVPNAPSAASRFHLIDSMLLSIARSNLSALMMLNFFSHILFAFCWSGANVILQEIVLFHNDWVKTELIWSVYAILVHGLMIKEEMAGDVYTLIFCSSRIQLRNPAQTSSVSIIFVPLFLSEIVMIGLDHWASMDAPQGNPLNVDKISMSVPLKSGLLCVQIGWIYVCRFPLRLPLMHKRLLAMSVQSPG